MNDSSHTNHPEDLLDLHALHALDQDDERRLQAHLEHWAPCQQSLAQKLRVAAMLGQMVEQRPPPARLQGQVMRAVARGETQAGGGGPSVRHFIARAPWTRLALPVAASLFAVVLTASLAMHYFTANRLEALEEENLALAERLTLALTAAAQERKVMGQLQAANYMIADPRTQRLPLEPVNNGDSPYHGVLLVSEDGRHAVLLVAGMAPSSSSEDYQESYPVWLLRPGKRVIIGEVKVDTTGWGSVSLAPQESVFGFDWVALSSAQETGTPPAPESLVLRTRITAGGTR